MVRPRPEAHQIHVRLNLKRLFAGSNGKGPDPATEDRLPESGIIEFYGKWCGYCRMIDPAVDKLEQEDGFEITRLETWGNRRNKALMESLSDLFEEFNRGNYTVPTFYDPTKPRRQQILVNPSSYEEIKAWAVGSGKDGKSSRGVARRARKKAARKRR